MYQNGKTALAFVSSEIDASIKDIDNATASGFPGCPPDGVKFHMAIARSTKAQLMWQGVQVEHAIQADSQRQTEDAPTIAADTQWGKFKASGSGAMNPIIKIVGIVAGAIVMVMVTGKINSMYEQVQQVSAALKQIESHK